MSDTPITDAAKRYIDGFADEWVPRYVCEELERERDGWREAANGLASAIPVSWEELQPLAAQLQKYIEMTTIENEKIKKKYNL